MTAQNSSRSFDVPEYLKRPDIGVKEISLIQRNLIIKYFVTTEMKGEIKVLITGNWDDD
jgi:hypothetical protein